MIYQIYNIDGSLRKETRDYKKFEKGLKVNHGKVKWIPENIVEEDELNGHYFPGHETWDDFEPYDEMDLLDIQ